MPATRPAPNTSKTAVRMVHVRKTYPNGPATIDALRSLSVALIPGSVTAVMGPSGSGKSTFLNCAAGLEEPTSGQIYLGDAQITAMSPKERTQLRRTDVGFVFQSYHLIDHLTVSENITLPLLLDGQGPHPQWRDYLLDAVGLSSTRDRLPGELSGGQRQRVAIARALIARPTVVFADEPTGALDGRTGGQVLQILRSMVRDLEQTLVLVTHDATVAAGADDVLFLADGAFAGHLQHPSAGQIRTGLQDVTQ